MKPLTSKKEFCILLICIIVLSSLCYGIYYNGKDLSCDNCILNFKTIEKPVGGRVSGISQNVSVSIPILYEYWQRGECYLTFDSNSGFRINK